MEFTRAELKLQAKEQMKGKVWGIFGVAFLGVFIPMLVSGLAAYLLGSAGTIVSSLVEIFVGFPMTIGIVMMVMNVTYGETPKVVTLFDPFKSNYGRNVLLMFLIGLFVALWSCLLVIPGIIAALSYSQAVYIAIENPDMSAMDCIKASKAMMKGRKWEYFVLYLSFILWFLLVEITAGIASIYVAPYLGLTMANYYHRIKGASAPVAEAVEAEATTEA